MSYPPGEVELLSFAEKLGDPSSVGGICQIARRMGVHESRVRQLLGRHGKSGLGLEYSTAIRLAEAFGRDPTDVGL